MGRRYLMRFTRRIKNLLTDRPLGLCYLLILAAVLFEPGTLAAGVKFLREYQTHLPRDRKLLFDMTLTPEQDVLLFMADAGGNWKLSRIRRWLDQPEEQTITIPGLKLGDKKKWFGPWEARLLVTPDGKYAIARASGRLRKPASGEEEFISVIDLSSFKLLKNIEASQLASVAKADYRLYHLDRHGHLIAEGHTPFPRYSDQDITKGGEQINLVILSIPDLVIGDRCEYLEWINSGVTTRREGEESCAALLGQQGISSVSQLYTIFPLEEEQQSKKPRPPQCPFLRYVSHVSADGLFEREICRNEENIFSVRTGEQVGSIPEPAGFVRSRFASVNAREYLLLVEGGTRLLVYAITE